MDPEGNLWFSNLTRGDKATYTCAATANRRDMRIVIRVQLIVTPSRLPESHHIHGPVQQYVTRRNEVGYRGNEANLYCIY